MQTRPETIRMLCNNNLNHSYEIPASAIDIECPHCGCKYGRIDTSSGQTRTEVVVDTKEPWGPQVNSWITELEKREADGNDNTRSS